LVYVERENVGLLPNLKALEALHNNSPATCSAES
jgi:hypothetical protein